MLTDNQANFAPEDPNLIPNAERIRLRQEREAARNIAGIRPANPAPPTNWQQAAQQALGNPAPATPWNQPPPIPEFEWPDVIGAGAQQPGAAPWGREERTVRTYTLQIGVLERLRDQCQAAIHQMLSMRENAQEQTFVNEGRRLPYFLVGDFAVVNRREHGEVARYLNDVRQTTGLAGYINNQRVPNTAWTNPVPGPLTITWREVPEVANPIITAGLAQANTAAQAEALRQILGEPMPEPTPAGEPQQPPF